MFEYIDGHLDETLTLDQLSEIASFSKYHFQRLFTQLYGIGVFQYIQLSRLKKASYLLAFREDIKIIEVALECGCEGSESFSRAFRKNIGTSPKQFRKNPECSPWFELRNQLANVRRYRMSVFDKEKPVKLLNVEKIRLVVLEHKGSSQKIGESIRKFIRWRKAEGFSPDKNATYNILYNDPEEVSAEDYRIDICVETGIDISESDLGLKEKIIPQGRCASMRHIGSDDTLPEAIRYLYADWYPKSDEELRDFPLYIQRVTFYPDVPETEAITDIFLPLK